MDTKSLMNEMGGAFAVTWLVFGATVWNDPADMLAGTSVVGLGLASVGGMFAMGIAWMAFNGAHILPPVTWMNIMTSDMSDQDMWMNNGLKLVMQVVGAALAIVLMAEVLEWDMVTYAQAYPTGQGDYEFDAMAVAGLVAAGAVLGHINSKVDNDWAMPVAVMAMAGLINFESAADMASMIMNDTGDAVAVALPWLLDGAFVGAGAFVGGWIDENL
ncbi:MAG: hypothetical protein P8Q35_00895 [Candidatus Thalassarchaeaceae archaeon]|nr:hypothetical protein [Candidatus Thalassarchaeaceae archaeon]